MVNVLFILLLCASTAFAQNIHFFGSVKAAKNTIQDKDTTFDGTTGQLSISRLTTAGLSVDGSINEKLQVLSQFTLREEKYIGVDLLQMRYLIDEGLMVRLGKQRLPSNLHSENIQIQALLPWMTAPREIYARVPIYSFTGASVEKKLGKYLGVHAYAGDTKDEFAGERADYKVSSTNLMGLRLNLKIKAIEAFANFYQADGKLKISSPASLSSAGFPSGTEGDFVKDYDLEKIQALTGGMKYTGKKFFFLSEYSRLSSKSPMVETLEAASASIGKDINEKWTPVVTFSTELDVASRLAPSKISTYAANLNYRLDFNNVIKFGFEHICYKERTVASGFASPLPTTTNATTFTNASPGENFDIYSLMWAFVY